jgi:hypothetical protein
MMHACRFYIGQEIMTKKNMRNGVFMISAK